MANVNEIKITGRIKKLPNTPAGSTVIDWLNQNAGNFPGKVILKAMPGGATAQAVVDDKPIGIVQGNDGRPYPCSEFNFDDKGVCVDDYTITITGMVPGVANTMAMTIVKHIVAVEAPTEVGDLSKFDSEVERIVNAGIRTHLEMTQILASMKQNGLTDKEIMAILKFNSCKRANVRHPKAMYQKVNNEQHMRRMTQFALAGRSFVLEGGQSVGKNVSAETLCYWLNLPWYLVTMSADMSTDDIYGGKSTDNTASNHLTMDLAKRALAGDKDAAIEYDLYKAKAASVQIVMDESEFCRWLEEQDENGQSLPAVFILNEMNMADPNLLAGIFNQVLDGTSFISVPGRGRLNVNPGSFIIGTQNPGFEGTQTQNQATTSRFGVFKFGYPENIVAPLRAGLGDFADEVPGVVYNQVNKLYMETLAAVKSGEISDACLNIRGYVSAIKMAVQWDDSLADHIMLDVVNGCPVEDQAVLAQKVSLHFE
ncbi:MAG: AAA family ATPase [Bacteroidaceae bacterium]|nr:AAA family ATPase [Bacteroidaceae bacterium]